MTVTESSTEAPLKAAHIALGRTAQAHLDGLVASCTSHFRRRVGQREVIAVALHWVSPAHLINESSRLDWRSAPRKATKLRLTDDASERLRELIRDLGEEHAMSQRRVVEAALQAIPLAEILNELTLARGVAA